MRGAIATDEADLRAAIEIRDKEAAKIQLCMRFRVVAFLMCSMTSLRRLKASLVNNPEF